MMRKLLVAFAITLLAIGFLYVAIALQHRDSVERAGMGSGTTLRACKDLNIPCVGIELEEKYCEIAANRLRQEVFDFGVNQ